MKKLLFLLYTLFLCVCFGCNTSVRQEEMNTESISNTDIITSEGFDQAFEPTENQFKKIAEKIPTLSNYDGEWVGYIWSQDDEDSRSIPEYYPFESLFSFGQAVKVNINSKGESYLLTENSAFLLDFNDSNSNKLVFDLGEILYDTSEKTDFFEYNFHTNDTLYLIPFTMETLISPGNINLIGSLQVNSSKVQELKISLQKLNQGKEEFGEYTYFSYFPSWVGDYSELIEGIRGIYFIVVEDYSWSVMTTYYVSYLDENGIEHISSVKPNIGLQKPLNGVQAFLFREWVNEPVNGTYWDFFLVFDPDTATWTNVSSNYKDYYKETYIPQMNSIIKSMSESDDELKKSHSAGFDMFRFSAQSLIDGEFHGGDGLDSLRYAQEHYYGDK